MRLVPLAALVLALPACGGGGHDGHGDKTAGGTVVPMTATDALRFDPSTVTAKAGETVTFRIANTGAVTHEFVIGDAAFHDSHRSAAASPGGSGHGGHGDGKGGAAADLPPGQTVSVTFTMPATAPAFACYVDRHDRAGMTGKVVYGT